MRAHLDTIRNEIQSCFSNFATEEMKNHYLVIDRTKLPLDVIGHVMQFIDKEDACDLYYRLPEAFTDSEDVHLAKDTTVSHEVMVEYLANQKPARAIEDIPPIAIVIPGHVYQDISDELHLGPTIRGLDS